MTCSECMDWLIGGPMVCRMCGREDMDITRRCKADTGKPRPALVPPAIIEAVGEAGNCGTRKYGDAENWRQVEPARCRDAIMRHVCAYLRDPGGTDAESGLPHLAHAACNIAFLPEPEESKEGKYEPMCR